MSNLDQALANLGAAIAANPSQPAPELPKTSGKVVQLPLFHKEAPAAPNAVLRSALFPAIHGKDRRFLDNELVASIDGVEVKMLGKQFNQDDLEALLGVEDLAREQPDTLTCQVSERGLLKLLGRKSGQTNEKALNESLVRLEQPVTVKMGRFSYSGGFIQHVYKDEETKRYVIQLNPRLGALLRSGWTALDTDTRRKLARKAPRTLAASLLRHAREALSLQGRNTARVVREPDRAAAGNSAQNLKNALDDWAATGDIQGWSIDPETDLLHITKPKKIGRPTRRQ